MLQVKHPEVWAGFKVFCEMLDKESPELRPMPLDFS